MEWCDTDDDVVWVWFAIDTVENPQFLQRHSQWRKDGSPDVCQGTQTVWPDVANFSAGGDGRVDRISRGDQTGAGCT